MQPESTSSSASPFVRWITRAPLLLSKHLWVWPLLGAVLLAGVGFWVHGRLLGATRAELASRLQTLLNADIAALRLWFSEQESDAKSFAADVRIQEAISELARLAQGTNCSAADLVNSEAARTLQFYLKPLLESQHYLDYVVVGTDKRILASPHRHMVYHSAPAGYELFLEKALAGELSVSRPFARELTFSQRLEGPTMFVAAPVKSATGAIIAVLGLRMRPEEEFSQIFSVARMGKTGEAYAFDRRGVMLTASRFDQELKALGLIPNVPEATAILNLRLADPAGEMPAQVPSAASRADGSNTVAPPRFLRLKATRVERTATARNEPPLTRMAAAATKGKDGVDVAGYHNYRGVKVVGAWAWLPEYGMGVATEVAAEEAFEMLYMLRQAFLVLFLLLVLSGGAIFGFTVVVERLEASARKNALAARRLGQYVLVQEIGQGANGMVYRARHALLRRSVAVKLLSPELTNEITAARFEQEVQLTSQLTHPNTVAIYDYGRTPEGLFYYAMEFLNGIDLDELVCQFGPQPEARVIHILRQVCGSLAEAHRIGLIHRDIKPANIMLTRRGGNYDVVKVLDFGLVKAKHLKPTDRTMATAVVGTPHYMSPEAIDMPESVDARSDLYSVGAAGYWLLTGKTLFEGKDVEEILAQHVQAMPTRPSERLGRRVAADLENLLMSCLAKTPGMRPASVEALAEALGRCAGTEGWTERQREEWWQANLKAREIVPAVTMPEKTLVIAART